MLVCGLGVVRQILFIKLKRWEKKIVYWQFSSLLQQTRQVNIIEINISIYFVKFKKLIILILVVSFTLNLWERKNKIINELIIHY